MDIDILGRAQIAYNKALKNVGMVMPSLQEKQGLFIDTYLKLSHVKSLSPEDRQKILKRASL